MDKLYGRFMPELDEKQDEKAGKELIKTIESCIGHSGAAWIDKIHNLKQGI